MAFPVPKPSDWNQPGDERVIAEAAAQLKRKEPEDMPMTGVGLKTDPYDLGNLPPRQREDMSTVGPKSDPYVPQERLRVNIPQVDPSAKAYAEFEDPFRPIREIGREESTTFHFIIEDNRPFASVPLSGPGAYEVTILRRR